VEFVAFSNLLKADVEHVFNVLVPEENGHAETAPHVLQQVFKAAKSG
jgi:hypothetical protein